MSFDLTPQAQHVDRILGANEEVHPIIPFGRFCMELKTVGVQDIIRSCGYFILNSFIMNASTACSVRFCISGHDCTAWYLSAPVC